MTVVSLSLLIRLQKQLKMFGSKITTILFPSKKGYQAVIEKHEVKESSYTKQNRFSLLCPLSCRSNILQGDCHKNPF